LICISGSFLFSYCMIYKKQTLFYMVKAAWLSV